MNSSKISIASVVTAIGASLCCSLPILASILGISLFSSIASFFSEYRIYFLIATGLLLILAYIALYRRSKAECDCEMQSERNSILKRKASLVSVTVLVIVVSFLPEILLAFQNKEKRPEDYSKIAVVTITGMTCQSCATHIESSLNKVKGVSGSSVNFKSSIAKVYTKAEVSLDSLKEAVVASGYDVKGIKWQQN